MDKTKIQWTDATWNPVRGCSRVGPECDNCYAMRQAHRTSGPGGAYNGLTVIRNEKVDWRGYARFHPETLQQPLRWKRSRRIFVNSMSDLFHESLTNEEIAAVFGIMAAAPQHTFQVLTKRPERMAEWFAWLKDQDSGDAGGVLHNALGLAMQGIDGWDDDDRHCEQLLESCNDGWPLANVWLGTSVGLEDAQWRIDALRKVPAVLRFLSLEPLLGPLPNLNLEGIHWVIVGGESGHGARPCALEWIEGILDQCRAAGVACFIKQLGAVVVSEERTAPEDMFPKRKRTKYDYSRNGEVWAWSAGLAHKKGGDPEEWPSKLRVRQFPGDELTYPKVREIVDDGVF